MTEWTSVGSYEDLVAWDAAHSTAHSMMVALHKFRYDVFVADSANTPETVAFAQREAMARCEEEMAATGHIRHDDFETILIVDPARDGITLTVVVTGRELTTMESVERAVAEDQAALEGHEWHDDVTER